MAREGKLILKYFPLHDYATTSCCPVLRSTEIEPTEPVFSVLGYIMLLSFAIFFRYYLVVSISSSIRIQQRGHKLNFRTCICIWCENFIYLVNNCIFIEFQNRVSFLTNNDYLFSKIGWLKIIVLRLYSFQVILKFVWFNATLYN